MAIDRFNARALRLELGRRNARIEGLYKKGILELRLYDV